MDIRERVLVAIAAISFLAALISLTPRRHADEDPTTTAWRRIGRERPTAEPGCPEPGCPAEPIDLYCFEHEVYLPRRDAEQSRSAWGVIGAVAAGALFWTAAAYDSAFPLYVVFTGALWGVLRLTLRRLPLARDVAQVTWAAAAVAVPVYADAPDWLRRAAIAGALLVALGAWVVHTAVEAADRAAEPDRRVVTASVTALGAAAAISSAYAIASYLPRELDPRGALPDGLLRVVLVGAFAAFGISTAATALGKGRGSRETNAALLAKPALPRPLEFPKPAPAAYAGGGFLGPVTRPVRVCCVSTVRIGAQLAEKAVNFARQCFHVLVTAVVTVLNLMWSSRLLAFRYLADAGAQWLRLLRTVLGLTVGVGTRSLRMTVLPVAAAGAAVAAAWAAAAAQRGYLVRGDLGDAGAAAGWCLLALGAATLVWTSWSGLPTVRAMYSAARTVGQVVAVALGCQAVGGWVLGVAGAAGYGPVRVGWVTGAATLVFGVFFVWSMLRRGEAPGERPTVSLSKTA